MSAPKKRFRFTADIVFYAVDAEVACSLLEDYFAELADEFGDVPEIERPIADRTWFEGRMDLRPEATP